MKIFFLEAIKNKTELMSRKRAVPPSYRLSSLVK
jgi:hypothetical protein